MAHCDTVGHGNMQESALVLDLDHRHLVGCDRITLAKGCDRITLAKKRRALRTVKLSGQSMREKERSVQESDHEDDNKKACSTLTMSVLIEGESGPQPWPWPLIGRAKHQENPLPHHGKSLTCRS